MIEFDHVSKRYENGTDALKDVNIKIEKGEFVFVVGSSGAGKSTFLKLIMREEVPSAGTIVIDGITLNKMRKRNIPKLRRKLGIVFQDFRLIPTMTVFDNVAFAMRVIGTKEKKIRRRVPYVLSLMGLNEKARSYPKELSGGEQQRVALARALANNADIIIADEPTGNVDPQMSYEIVDLLMRLNEAGTTVIMVTHEHSLVRAFDKRVVILDKGTVVSDGETLDRESATAHINAASEIANEHIALPEEDYSAYAPTVEMELDPNHGLEPSAASVTREAEAAAEAAEPEEAEEAFDLELAVAEVLSEETETVEAAEPEAAQAPAEEAEAAPEDEEPFDLEQAVSEVLAEETAEELIPDLPAEDAAEPAAAPDEAPADDAAAPAAEPEAAFDELFDLELVDLDAQDAAQAAAAPDDAAVIEEAAAPEEAAAQTETPAAPETPEAPELVEEPEEELDLDAFIEPEPAEEIGGESDE